MNQQNVPACPPFWRHNAMTALTLSHKGLQIYVGFGSFKIFQYVLSGINRKLMICHCSDGYSFFNLKGLRSLKSKNVSSALTGTLF
jgi:hypothetical protein